jgi:hypothetical protein
MEIDLRIIFGPDKSLHRYGGSKRSGGVADVTYIASERQCHDQDP